MSFQKQCFKVPRKSLSPHAMKCHIWTNNTEYCILTVVIKADWLLHCSKEVRSAAKHLCQMNSFRKPYEIVRSLTVTLPHRAEMIWMETFRRNSETPPILNFTVKKKSSASQFRVEMDVSTSFSAHQDELPVMTAIWKLWRQILSISVVF